LHDEKPDVIQLCIHLSEQHRVIFQNDERLEDVIEHFNTEKTTFTV